MIISNSFRMYDLIPLFYFCVLDIKGFNAKEFLSAQILTIKTSLAAF